MDKSQLESLRDQILGDVTPLVINNTQDASEKFNILLRIIRSGRASNETYSSAYESAKNIEDGGDKLGALLALLDEIDVDIAQDGARGMSKPVEETQNTETPENQNF